MDRADSASADFKAGAPQAPLTLHIPPHHAGPGERPDYKDVPRFAAGAVARPDIAVPAQETHSLAYQLIRVLDDDGAATGEWNPTLDTATLQRGLRAMMLTRAYDERMFRQQRQGKISFYMKCTGEEAIGVGQALALAPDDMVFTTYRQQGLLIARGWPLLDMMCQCYSNSQDRMKGRQLPVLYSSKEASFFSISGNLGTQFPQAVGWAMASAYKGDRRIAAGWIGEGSTAEPDFHHALTFASVYRAPVILNVVNNQWAISSHQEIAGGEAATFAARAIGFGLACLRVDGNDLLAVYAATQWAAERARHNHGATLIELFTYRAAPHSTSDDPNRYRPEDEGKEWPLGDPIERLSRHLIRLGEWSGERQAQLESELADQVRETGRTAESYGTQENGPHFSAKTMFEDVFKETPWHLRRQRQELGV
ncbi:MAG TPA: thiamine pyrophosphate-dependent enzyme [Stellaceae bacterium]|jgi:2-oxoisovalerate dehydrogenase E1 component alpha subunit|nr:thiamine pyrophosphate-dependent enzyme [Stellaceae bacterium]